MASENDQLYRQVVVQDFDDNARLYQLLTNCTRNPTAAAAVRTVVAKFDSSNLDFRLSHDVFSGQDPSSDRDPSYETFSNAIETLGLSHEDRLAWLGAVTWMDPEAVKARKQAHEDELVHFEANGFQRSALKFGSNDRMFQMCATFLLLISCPQIQHLVLDLTAGLIPHGPSNILQRNNYGRLAQQHLTSLKHVTILPGGSRFEEESYRDSDPLGALLSFHRLPQLETFSIQLVSDCHGGDTTDFAVPMTSPIRSIKVTYADVSSATLAMMIRVPRALRAFTYLAGGDWADDGGNARFKPKTVAKALWSQRKSLEEIDIVCDSRIHDRGDQAEEEDSFELPEGMYDEDEEPDPEQDANVMSDRKIEIGGPAPLYPNELPTTRAYRGTIGSLHDFTSLRRLSIGIKFLLGQGNSTRVVMNQKKDGTAGYSPENVVFEAPFRLIDALPQSLEYLQLHGYTEGEQKHWDEQIRDLMAEKSARLPSLKQIEGVESRLWSDVDFPQRKPHDPRQPKRALTPYFLFMKDIKPLVRQEHPDWDPFKVSTESERRWVQLPVHKKKLLDHSYNVDLARYYRQKEEYVRGKGVREINAEEAKELYLEHLRTGTVIKGRKGLSVLEQALTEGTERVDPNLVERVRAALEVEEAREEHEAEAQRVKLLGPEYKWLEAEAGTERSIELQHNEL